MSTLEAVTTKYTKQYLPGYTGHVPAKNDLFGLTAGDANRLILRTSLAQTSTDFKKGFAGPTSPFRDTRTFIKHRDYKALIEAQNIDSVKFGNNSRFAKNWISGPNHQIYNQHVPRKFYYARMDGWIYLFLDYTGHIPGITAENMFSKSYAKTTAVALHGKFPRGHDLPKKDRYRSQSMSEYNPLNFRRYIENPKIQQNKDFQDYKQFIQGKNVVTINALGRAGWTTHKEGFPQLPDQRNRNPSARSGSEVPHTPFDPMKSGPVASEKKYQQNVDFARLSDGFKRILCNNNDEKEMKIPIVGFAGHQKGIKARNFYGKAFRETSLASKKVLRSTLSP